MIDDLFFNEIMKTVPIGEEKQSFGLTLPIIGKYADIQLKTDDKGNLHYEVSTEQVKKSEITNEELIELKTDGWELSENGLLIIKKLN